MCQQYQSHCCRCCYCYCYCCCYYYYYYCYYDDDHDDDDYDYYDGYCFSVTATAAITAFRPLEPTI